MLRFFAGAGSAMLLLAAGFFIWTGIAGEETSPVPPPPAGPGPASGEGAPEPPPAADARSKEQRRFDRADRDKNGRIGLDELFQPRRRAFARLDTDHDGRLSFEEWAVRTATKFGEADANRDRALDRTEFAATAPRRRAPVQGSQLPLLRKETVILPPGSERSPSGGRKSSCSHCRATSGGPLFARSV